MKNKSPLISVLMPVYNSMPFLEQAIRSILNQEFVNFELLILDDGSTDNSLAIIEKLAVTDPRIQYYSRHNKGISITRNELVDKASAGLIAWMDSDDVSLSNRLSLQFKFLNDHPDHVAVGCHTEMIDEQGAVICDWPLLTEHEEIDQWHISGKGGAIIFPSSMMRKDKVLIAGGFDVNLTGAEDLALFLQLAEIGKLANIPEKCFHYRQHINSICHYDNRQIGIDTQTVINEAARRRGIKPVTLKQTPQFKAKHEIYNKWAWWALIAKNSSTARKYAYKAVLGAPLTINYWKTLLCSIRGY